MRRPLVFLLCLTVLLTPLAAEETPQPKRRKKLSLPPDPIEKVLEPIFKPVEKILKKGEPKKATLQGKAPLTVPAPQIPHVQLPPTPPPERPAIESFFMGAARYMTTSWGNNIFVWLPAISTDPNTGPTYGLLPVLVLADTQRIIRHLIAPSITYNRTFGATGTARYYYYPSPDSQLTILASLSRFINRELKGRYENTRLAGGHLALYLEAVRSIDGSKRFFGVGQATHETAQTSYASRETLIRGDLGWNLFKIWRLSAGARFRRAAIDKGTGTLPDIRSRFPTQLGLDPTTTTTQNVRFLYDTRDYAVTPTKGTAVEFFGESTNFGSNSDFKRYGYEGQTYLPYKGNVKYITAFHSQAEYVYGDLIPFYEMASLGGQKTLRGFGEGRFLEKGSLLFNLEERIALTTMRLMDVQTTFEVAPFADLGVVFPGWSDMRRKDFHLVLGGAFRAVVRPNVVGSVDVGVGREGIAVFVGINYPF